MRRIKSVDVAVVTKALCVRRKKWDYRIVQRSYRKDSWRRTQKLQMRYWYRQDRGHTIITFEKGCANKNMGQCVKRCPDFLHVLH